MKVELMERWMETVKKQADAITEVENELAKVRKQERAYKEAMEQLQTDLDALEQDNAKLKTFANNPERQASTAQVVEAGCPDGGQFGDVASRQAGQRLY